jgi:hypothetical protein
MTDPVTAANAFATIIALICNYRQEKGGHEQLNHQKFVEWLEYHRHEEIKNLIVNTATLRGEVDQLLRADYATMMSKLDKIALDLAFVTSQVKEFQGLTLTLIPHAGLSDQAIKILKYLVTTQCQYWVFLDDGHQVNLQAIGEDKEDAEPLHINEERFLRDDISTLIERGFLRAEKTSDISTCLYITRKAAQFVFGKDTERS